MSKRTGFSSRVTALLVVGDQSRKGLTPMMRRAFRSRVRFVENLDSIASTPRMDLVIGVYSSINSDGSLAFRKWVSTAARSSIHVEIGAGEAIIGPLALPQRAGCSHCAGERMAAAALSHDQPNVEISASHQSGVMAAAGAVLIREIRKIERQSARASPLLDHLLIITSSDAGASCISSRHRVIPLSHCPFCGGAAIYQGKPNKPRLLSPAASPSTVLATLAGWVDPRTGVISRVVVEPPDERGVTLPIVVTAAPPHIRDEQGAWKRLPIGWGKGLTLSGALLSATGEAIERYSASLPDPSRLVWKRLHDLEGEVLDPRIFRFYSDRQYQRKGFPYVPFDPNVCHPWVRGRFLGSGLPVWTPALLVFLSISLQADQLICQGSSNGLAASTGEQDAVWRATMELVERDAFMAAWLTGSAGRKIELDNSLDIPLRGVLKGIEDFGAVVEIYLLSTSACGSTVLGLALGDGKEYPGVTIGLGTDPDPRVAANKAILELGQTGPHLRHIMRDGKLVVPAKPQQVRDMLDHAAWYFPVERAAAFDRLRASRAGLAFGDLRQQIPRKNRKTCEAELRAAGIRVALVDVTAPDVATGPFRVVRAISPDLQPISYGYGLDFQPSERIRRRGLVSDIPAIHPLW